MKNKVLVIGSSNTDMVVRTTHFPKPGETILGGTFLMNPGGKGANQAVAAARLGSDLRFVTKLGKDIFGEQALKGFQKEKMDVRFIKQTDQFASGVALITVADSGENEIVVASGANMDLNPSDIPDQVFEGVGYVLLQLEIPLSTVEYIIKKCHDLNVKVILNPAPAAKLNDEVLQMVYLITPNETETEILTGILPDSTETLQKAGAIFLQKGVENVIVTLGKNGVFLMNNSLQKEIPALKVTAVDTTAAGDVFNGALLTALANGKDIIEACEFATKASAISVTRLGAQSSAPYLHEIH